MRLSQELNSALVNQIHEELQNANIYRQVSCFFEDIQLKNLARYFLDAANQESEHANKFMQHINDRAGGKVIIGEVDSPNLNITTIEEVCQVFLDTEERTTESIENLYEIASSTKSFIDLPFLLSMLSEQVEEEDIAQEFAGKVKLVRDLILFDSTFEK